MIMKNIKILITVFLASLLAMPLAFSVIGQDNAEFPKQEDTVSKEDNATDKTANQDTRSKKVRQKPIRKQDNRNVEFSIQKNTVSGADLVPGKTVRLGTWGEEGKRRPIEWLVLRKNNDGSFMLISKKVLSFNSFDKAGRKTEWQNSSLGAWLNGFFYESAFSKNEKMFITYDYVEPSKNPKYKTWNSKTRSKVYLLGIEEAESLFAGEESLIAESEDYSGRKKKAGKIWWWLRTNGNSLGSAAFINGKGKIDYKGYDTDSADGGVRPVIRYRPYSTIRLGTTQFLAEQSGTAPRPMEWAVLDEEADGTQLLMSMNAFALMPYHNAKEAVQWQDSDLRKWLNGEFFEKTFSAAEKEGIVFTSNIYNAMEMDKIYIPYPEMIDLYVNYVNPKLMDEPYIAGNASLGSWVMQKPDNPLIRIGKALLCTKTGSIMQDGIDVNYKNMPVFAVMRFNQQKYNAALARMTAEEKKKGLTVMEKKSETAVVQPKEEKSDKTPAWPYWVYLLIAYVIMLIMGLAAGGLEGSQFIFLPLLFVGISLLVRFFHFLLQVILN